MDWATWLQVGLAGVSAVAAAIMGLVAKPLRDSISELKKVLEKQKEDLDEAMEQLEDRWNRALAEQDKRFNASVGKLESLMNMHEQKDEARFAETRSQIDERVGDLRQEIYSGHQAAIADIKEDLRGLTSRIDDVLKFLTARPQPRPVRRAKA